MGLLPCYLIYQKKGGCQVKENRIKSSYNSGGVAFIFLFPFMLLYGVFTIYPLISGFIMSLHSGRFGMEQKFVGFENYLHMFKDPYFYQALKNTLIFVAISTPLIVVLGLAFGLLSNSKIRGATFIKIATFLPYVLSISVITSIWVYIFKPHLGLINNVLMNLGIIKQQILWFDKTPLAFTTIIVATLWWTVGFNTILFLAGLQEIPSTLYEASSIDGAGKIKQFFYITLPSLKGVITMITLLQIISSFKIFGQPWLMTGGGPGTTTRPIVQYIYEIGFSNWDVGYASSMSYMLLLIMVLVAITYNYFFVNQKEHDNER